MSAYVSVSQTNSDNKLHNSCFEVDAFRKEFFDRILIKFKKNASYKFLIEYSGDKFVTSKFVGSPTHDVTKLVEYETKKAAVDASAYINFDATYDDNVCYIESSNLASKKRFMANSFRIHAYYISSTDNTITLSEFYPVLYSIADVFYGRQINLSEGMTIATAVGKENVLNIDKSGFKIWGYAGNLHANIGQQDNGEYGAWFPQIRIGGTAWSNAPFKTDTNGNILITSPSTYNANIQDKGVISVNQTNPNLQTVSCFYGETLTNARIIRGIITSTDASSHDLISSEYIFRNTVNLESSFGMRLIVYPEYTNYPNEGIIVTYAHSGIRFSTPTQRYYDTWNAKYFTIEKKVEIKGELWAHGQGLFQGSLSCTGSLTGGGITIATTASLNHDIYFGDSSGWHLRFLRSNDFAVALSVHDKIGVTVGGSTYNANTPFYVETMKGNTTAIFGTDRPICMVAGTGAIGFNTYYNNGWKRYTANAHTGVINMDALGSGRIFFQHFGIGADTTSALTATESLSLFPSGNVSIGNSADSGHKLYVAGTAYINGFLSTCGGLFVKGAYSGGHARGFEYINNSNGTTAGGIGGLGVNGEWNSLYMAVAQYPWDSAVGLTITSNNITWKNNNVVHEGMSPNFGAKSITCGNMTLNQGLVINNEESQTGVHRLWLYKASNEAPWWLGFSPTSVFGGHGDVSGNCAMYLTVDNTSGNMTTRGWIFRAGHSACSANVASISVGGTMTINGAFNMSGGNFNLTNDKIIYQTNNNWGGKLQIGYSWYPATPRDITSTQAFIAASDGNLHLDSMNSHALYLNYHSQEAIYLHNGASSGGVAITSGGNILMKGVLDFVGATSAGNGENLRVGGIWGKLASNNLIHMYRRVHIGSPNGWGSMDAPDFGLSTYGSVQVGAQDVGSYLQINRYNSTEKVAYVSTTNTPDTGMKFQVQNSAGAWKIPLIINSNGDVSVVDAHQTFRKNNGTDGTIYYYTGNISIDTSDGSPAIIGFHRYGRSGIALYSNGGDVNNALRLMLQSGANYALLHEGNHPYNNGTWLAPALVSLGASRIYTYDYSSGAVGYAYLAGQMHVYCDGKFWQNEGNYACVDTSGATFSGNVAVPYLSITSLNSGGISLRDNTMIYGIAFMETGTWGKHGYVTGDFATYFTMNNSSGRGWVFRDHVGAGNVASISNAGSMTLNGYLTVGNSATSSISPFWVGKKVGSTVGLFGQTDQCPIMYYQYSADYTGMAFNAYHNGSSWYNITGGKSTFLIQHEPLNGALAFYGAPAVTAGSVPTWVKVFSIGTDGTMSFSKSLGTTKRSWNAISVSSGYDGSPDSGNFYQAAYCMGETNKVRLRGAIKNITGGSAGAGTIIGVIATTSCYPTKNMIFSVQYCTYTSWSSSTPMSGTIAVQIDTSGHIILKNTLFAGYTLFLDDIEYSVD